MTVNNTAAEAVLLKRQEYTSRLLGGFSLPLVTLFGDDAGAFDAMCVEIREAYAGSILYLKQFYYETGCEGYFVVDLPAERVGRVLDRLLGCYPCFEGADLKLHIK